MSPQKPISQGYIYNTYVIPVEQREVDPSVLSRVLHMAKQASARDIVVFDLDSTLLDNRPRETRIVREFGKLARIPELERCLPEYLVDWSLTRAMIACGLPKERAEALDPEVRQFWKERFFTSEYCADDTAIEGAVAFVQQLLKTPVQIVYCTGRHQAMVEGTLQSFEREGFPLPDNRRIHLVVKPTFEMDDDDFKQQIYTTLNQLGRVIAVFDNEPSHINGYHRVFSNAVAVHLLGKDSGRGTKVDPGVVSVRNFLMPSQ